MFDWWKAGAVEGRLVRGMFREPIRVLQSPGLGVRKQSN